jgi:hypothetical protein
MRTLQDIFLLLTIATVAQSQGIAQDLPKPTANPIPEEALKEAPSFGGSRPADSPQVLPAEDKSIAPSDNATTEWKPRLMVKLRIQQPGTTQEETLKIPTASTSPFQTASIASAGDGNYAILKCDDVQVEVKTNDEGTPAYSFTCKDKAIIAVSGNTITADSIATVDGKLFATNAVIEMPNKTFVRSDKLTLELTIFEIEVKSAVEEVQKPKTTADSSPRFFNGDEPFGIEP